MPQAGTNNVSFRIKKESSWGQISGAMEADGHRVVDGAVADMSEARWTGGSLGHVKDTIQSQTLRATRNVDFLAEVAARAEGDVNMELAYSLDDAAGTLSGIPFEPMEVALAAEGAFYNNFVAVNLSETDISSSATDTLTNSGGWPAGLLKDHVIRVSGFSTDTAANGAFRVATKVGNDITVTKLDGTNPGFAGQASGDTIVVRANSLRNGTVAQSFLMELGFTDIANAFLYFTGCTIGRFGVQFASNQMVTAAMSVIGKGGFVDTVTRSDGTHWASGATKPVNATANAADLLIQEVGGDSSSSSAAVRSIGVELNNNIRGLQAVANRYAIGVNPGFCTVTGRIESYFEDTELVNAFINHEPWRISWHHTDEDGNTIAFLLPNIYFSGGSPQVPGGNDEVIQNLEYTGTIDPDGVGFTIQMDMVPA